MGIDEANCIYLAKDFILCRGIKLYGSKFRVIIIGFKHDTNHLNFGMINDVVIGGKKLNSVLAPFLTKS